MNTIHVTLECGEGCLRRLLGLIEGRGFSVETLSLFTEGAQHSALLKVVPKDDTRCTKLLTRQINRLQRVEAALVSAEQADRLFLASHGRGMHWA